VISNAPRLKLVGRLLWNAGAFIFYGGLLVKLGLLLVESTPADSKVTRSILGLCTNTVIHEAESPDSRYVARMIVVDCGAATSPEGGINVFDRQKDMTHRGLLNFRGSPESFSIAWSGNDTLVATGLKLESLTALRDPSSSGITVVLQDAQSRQ